MRSHLAWDACCSWRPDGAHGAWPSRRPGGANRAGDAHAATATRIALGADGADWAGEAWEASVAARTAGTSSHWARRTGRSKGSWSTLQKSTRWGTMVRGGGGENLSSRCIDIGSTCFKPLGYGRCHKSREKQWPAYT